MVRSRRNLALLSVACMMAVSACGTSGDSGNKPSGPSTKKITLTWWHNGNGEPLRGFWQQMADEYTASYPNVTIKVVPLQNEQFNTKLPAAMQSNDPPDIFQEWGGGQLATQVQAGKVMDLTEAVKPWIGELGASTSGWQIDGKQYGIPYSFGIVGFWYNKKLFAKAGITAPPATFEELLADIGKLKAAGIVPIAIGSKDKWPDAFWWDYMAVRACSKETLQKSAVDYDFSDACWVTAGTNNQRLIDSKPFQPGFLATPAQQGAGSSAALVANGKAAMELQGHWNPGVMSGLTTKKDALKENLGWFPFPSVDGGQGAADAALGGGDGFACSYKAPPQCVDFLKFLVSVDQQKKYGPLNVGLPVAKGSESSVSDPVLKDLLAFRNKASYIQTYFDVQYVTSVGKALNDAIARQFSGDASPAEVVKLISDAAKDR
jgi:raffinose/stachyose/melibiose transport system substrate-binding protein